jgi:non-ribosomal peptide synthetase component F
MAMFDPKPQTLVELLSAQAARYPDKLAYAMLSADEQIGASRTFSALQTRAASIAGSLRARCQPGERAVLLYPQGVEFIEAFFGCLSAGMIAVPAHLPRSTSAHRHTEILYGIAQDCQASVVLTCNTVQADVQTVLTADSRTAALPCLCTDSTTSESDARFRLTENLSNVATLIYTSGSMGNLNSITLSQQSLLHHLGAVTTRLGNSEEATHVNWVPHFHAPGLVMGMLGSLYCGASNYLLSPTHFLENPVRWLRSISRFRGRNAYGPDFAFELCARRISTAERQTLDLSSWQVALCGAEPGRAETLDRFAREFAPCGFRRQSFLPSFAEVGEVSPLRTGDLGFVQIVHGTNHPPQDLEKTAEQADPAIRPGGHAALAVESEGEERPGIATQRAESDLRAAEDYFRTALAGMQGPTPLPGRRPQAPTQRHADQRSAASHRRHLHAALSGQLQQLARTAAVTLNSLLQAAWALLLGRLAGTHEVLFGATVSGRPPGLRDIESRLGLFINTLPVRVRLDPRHSAVSLAQTLQAQQLQARAFEGTPLVQVQRLSPLPPGQPLFDSVLVFENYPLEPQGLAHWGGLELEAVEGQETTNYPLALVVAPGPQLRLVAEYDAAQFEPGAVERTLGCLETLLQGMVERPDAPLGELPLLASPGAFLPRRR